MIGAMPAVAVRHERRKRKPRPTQLYFGGNKQSPPSKGSTPCQSQAGSPASPSMLTQGQAHRQSHAEQSVLQPPPEFYVCGRVSVLHVVVVSLLLGSILLVVGLVQLKPGADASRHRLYFLAAGTLLLSLGMVLIFIRCCCCQSSIQQHHHGGRRLQKDDSAVSALGPVGNDENFPRTVSSINGNHTSSKKVAVIDEIEVPNMPNKVDSLDACHSLSIDLGVPMHSSHDTLQSVKSPSEHDALIKKSNSNLEANSLT